MPIFTCPDTPETYVVKELKDEIERLTAENAALREDTERLDWLSKFGEVIFYTSERRGGHEWFLDIDDEWAGHGKTFRAAINCAKEEQCP